MVLKGVRESDWMRRRGREGGKERVIKPTLQSLHPPCKRRGEREDFLLFFTLAPLPLHSWPNFFFIGSPSPTEGEGRKRRIFLWTCNETLREAVVVGFFLVAKNNWTGMHFLQERGADFPMDFLAAIRWFFTVSNCACENNRR